jgi:hypothetical protein
MKNSLEHIPIPQDDAPESPSRRTFLKKAAITAVALGIPSELEQEAERFLEEDKNKKTAEEKPTKEENTQTPQEHAPVVTTPLEQLNAWGEIRDMEAGIQAIYRNHRIHLFNDKNGKDDMKMATENIKKLPMKKIKMVYEGYGLPEKLAYMIAIQETRGRNITNKKGAQSITGLMPETLKHLGLKPEDVQDAVLASAATAYYFTVEKRERFGNDMDLLLHAYNAGGGLYGYTKSVRRKEDRNASDFYAFMQEKINTEYKKIEREGFYEHRIDSEDKHLTSISKRFEVPLEAIIEENGISRNTPIVKGQILRIPYTDMKKAARIIFRKPFEGLRYAPEIKAKYSVLKEEGLLNEIELAMN